MTVCRDAEHGVNWRTIRVKTSEWLEGAGTELLLRPETGEDLDPDTWGTSPEAQAALQQAMAMGGGVGGGPDA